MVTVYLRDSQGIFDRAVDIASDGPLPPRAVMIEPPPTIGTQVAQWNGTGWIVLAKRPLVRPSPAAEIEYVQALERHYDEVAQSRRYDNRLTCALRAGYPGPFHAEGYAFAMWMDQCNLRAYQIMAEVYAGDRPKPTIAETVAAMPIMEWPDETDADSGSV